MTDTVTVYIRPDDPDCALTVRFIRDRGIEPTVCDVTSDPSASAVLFGRLGRVAVPTVLIGDRLVVGYDPLQLARYLPRGDEVEPGVSFGAAVRSVSAALAAERGLPYTYGVEVGPVHVGSPAATAGIAPGDVITHLGAYTLQGGADQFRAAVTMRRPGDTMQLTVRRGDTEIALSVEFPKVEPPPPS